MKIQALNTYSNRRIPAFGAKDKKIEQTVPAAVSVKKDNTKKYAAGAIILAVLIGCGIYRARRGKAGKAAENVIKKAERQVKTFISEKKFTKDGQEFTLKYSRDNEKTVREIYNSENKLIKKVEKETKFSKNKNGKRYIDIYKKITKYFGENPIAAVDKNMKYTKYYDKNGRLEAILCLKQNNVKNITYSEFKKFMLIKQNKKIDMRKVYKNDPGMFDSTFANVTLRKEGKRIGKLSLSENPTIDGKVIEKPGNYALEYDSRGLSPKKITVIDLIEKYE